MYSLRYGTVPIVRATGGLDDSIQPFDPATRQGNGFKFTAYTPEAMMAAVGEALAAYEDRALWAVIRRNGMLQDYSWKRSAAKYVALYEDLIAAPPSATPVAGP
jgi:starch synthase